MRADHSCRCVRRPEHRLPSRSSRVRRRVRDRPAIRHRKSPPSRETEASSGDRNPAEERPIPIHPLGSPRPPRSIQDKLLIAISESRKPRRNSPRHSANAGLDEALVPQLQFLDRRAFEAAPVRSKNDAVLMGLALEQALIWRAKRAKDIPTVDRDFIEESRRAAGQRPVINVSWEDAKQYVGWLSFRGRMEIRGARHHPCRRT